MYPGQFPGFQLSGITTYIDKIHLIIPSPHLPHLQGYYRQTEFPGKRILAIGHGGFNRAIIVRIEKRQQEDILKLPIMKNTACLRFSI